MDKSRRKKRWIAAGLIAAVLIFSVVIWKFVGTPMVNFISDPAAFHVWVEANGWRARLIFAGMVIFQVVIAAIPGEPFEIAAGYAFGVVEGMILSIAAAAIV